MFTTMYQNRGLGDPPANERWDRVLSLLASEPRRVIIHSLVESPDDEPLPLPEAAESPNVSVSHDELRTALYHNHLPALADAGYVGWSSDPLRVWHGQNFEEIEAVIEVIVESADQFPSELIDGCGFLEQAVQA